MESSGDLMMLWRYCDENQWESQTSHQCKCRQIGKRSSKNQWKRFEAIGWESRGSVGTKSFKIGVQDPLKSIPEDPRDTKNRFQER